MKMPGQFSVTINTRTPFGARLLIRTTGVSPTVSRMLLYSIPRPLVARMLLAFMFGSPVSDWQGPMPWTCSNFALFVGVCLKEF